MESVTVTDPSDASKCQLDCHTLHQLALHMLKGKAASCPARLRMVANQSVRYIRLRFNMLIMTYLIPINLSFEPFEKTFFRNYSTSWPWSLGR